MPSDPSDLVLDRVRRAIATAARTRVAPQAHDDPASASEALPSPTAPTADLVTQFVEAARAADARVSVATTAVEARRRVAEILQAEHASQVLVSPEAAAEPWGCADGSLLPGASFIVRSGARNNLHDDVLKADVGITVPTLALADTGTLVLAASPGDHRLDSLLPPVHVALLPASRLVPDLFRLFSKVAAEDLFGRHSALTFVRGPSRTADIELTLTIGVHGPGKVYVVVVDDLRLVT